MYYTNVGFSNSTKDVKVIVHPIMNELRSMLELINSQLDFTKSLVREDRITVLANTINVSLCMLELSIKDSLRRGDVSENTRDLFVIQLDKTAARIKKFLIDLINEYEPDESPN